MSSLTNEQRRELQQFDDLSDDEIDTSNIPEITDFSGVVRGRFYRPVKQIDRAAH